MLKHKRDEYRDEKARTEAAFAAERKELQEQIDALKNRNRGWFGFGGGSGESAKTKVPSGNAGEAAAGGNGNRASPPYDGKLLI